MTLICRPSTPPEALICAIASFSASTEPVSEIAIVPVMECRMPTVTLSSVTARPVELIADVVGAAKALLPKKLAAGRAAMPFSSWRLRMDCGAVVIVDCWTSDPSFTRSGVKRRGSRGHDDEPCGDAAIRKITYAIPPNP